MARPPEYENLIKTNAFEPVVPTAGAIAGFLKNGADYLAAAQALGQAGHLQVFTMAYEGYFQIVQAVLEFHEVRTILEKYLPQAYTLTGQRPPA